MLALGVASGVRLTRLEYSQGAPGTELTEIQMDAGITGQYPQIMKFINSLERDQIFFLIRAMSLTGAAGRNGKSAAAAFNVAAAGRCARGIACSGIGNVQRHAQQPAAKEGE